MSAADQPVPCSIAGLDTGSSLFFDHRDPAVVSRLGNFRLQD